MWVTWRAAMQEALYGCRGFYARGECPAAHFRTSVHVSPRYAAAMLALLRHVDVSLGGPARLDLVDVGAGRGELLAQMLAMARHLPAGPAGPAPPCFPQRIVAHAVEITPRPEKLDPRIDWRQSVPSSITGLVIANEWLDNIPLDVAELAADGPRIMLVDTATGAERPGPLAGPADQAWLRRWWPLRHIGDRAEIGRTRCAAWADVVGRLDRGVIVGADYGHVLASRPALGTLAGYQDGRPVRPIPDGSRDITAHVAMDACAAAGQAAAGAVAGQAAAGARWASSGTRLTTQREALRALGLRGGRPALALARTDPPGYLAALRQASEEAELTDPGGLGGFSWLVQAVRAPLPVPLGPVLADPVLADPELADPELADPERGAEAMEQRVHG
jgi:SAM-dependent MidA family methyltransferase